MTIRSRIARQLGRGSALLLVWGVWAFTPAALSSANDPQEPIGIRFVDVTAEAGIRFEHVNGAFGKKYLPETMGSGGAFLDYDGDGWLDVFLVNATSWPEQKGKPGFPALYRNRGDGTFEDVTRKVGLRTEIYGMGVAAADVDNDGDTDLYLTALGPDRFFRNEGGRFVEATREAGLGNPDFGTSAAFFDYDNDGLLDLFVANYVQWTPETDIFCTLDGENKSYCTPEAYKGVSPRLYRNLGNGRFQDVTREAGLYDPTNKGLGVAVLDYNNDGWLDVALANDTQPNQLWENQGDGTFREVGVLAGIAFSEDGVARGAMGIDAADYDRSGNFSLVIGNFSNEMISLYHNEGHGFFINDAPTTGVGQASLLALTFGCFFFDFDLDGWPDIFAANGHVENDINRVQNRVTYAQRVLLFHNRGGRHFVDVAAQRGEAFRKSYVGRGAAYGDYDNDGDLDILLTQCGGPARLFRNEGGNRNHWIAFQLEGSPSNRDAVGARVRVRDTGGVQQAFVRTGGSYCSQSQLRLTFGLGPSNRVAEVEIRWPSGRVQELRNLPAGRLYRVREGRELEAP